MDSGEDCLGALIAIVVFLAILFWAVTFVAVAVYWVAATGSYWLMAGLAWLCSESLTPGRPELMWAIWGGLVGAVLGFWPSAHLYGRRKSPGLMLWTVMFMMLATASYVTFRARG